MAMSSNRVEGVSVVFEGLRVAEIERALKNLFGLFRSFYTGQGLTKMSSLGKEAVANAFAMR